MNAKISETGFWDGENAHHHHVHSPMLAQWIAKLLSSTFDIVPDDNAKHKRVYDYGAGLGFYLKTLEIGGFTNLVGFEGDPPAQKAFSGMWRQDLTQPIPEAFSEKGHIIMLEVGEHVPAEFQDALIDNVVKLCQGYLVLSWAVPGQAGYGHVNCLSNENVISYLESKGFVYLDVLTEDARQNVDDNTPWFRNTLLIFHKG